MSFESLELAPEILRAVLAEGYTNPTPIQAQSIPHLLAGMDLLGCAQTGTGKTAAFALPILTKLLTTEPQPAPQAEHNSVATHGRFHEDEQGHAHMLKAFSRTRHAPKYRRPTRALILSPTRELASQIADSFRTYGKGTRLRDVVVYGGVSQNPQVRLLQQGVDLIIATPGRLVDLTQQGWVDLSTIEMFVLDEADRMLDMGFMPDIRRIINFLPRERQTLLFSATMPGPIKQLAEQILSNPAIVTIAPEKLTTELIDQHVYHVTKAQKADLLTGLVQRPGFSRTIVFTQTKHGADRVCKQLERVGVRCEAIHGNKSQNARQRALNAFKASQIQVLVATDVAARGIDVDNITHVIQYDLPGEPETYVHRIGRTGRAGQSGLAISFCDPEQRIELRDIERLINRKLDVQKDHPEGIEVLNVAPAPQRAAPPPGKFRFGGAVRGKRFDGPRNGGGGNRPPRAERGERSFGGPRNDRPREDRSFGGPRNDRPAADRPRAERPHGDRPRGDRPHGDRPFGDRPRGDRPHGDRPHGERRGEGRGEFRGESRPFRGDRPARGEGRPFGDRPARGEGRPFGDRPDRAERPARGANVPRPANAKNYGGSGKFKFKANRRPTQAK
ncbi:DEAD/DEAH box helicase [Anatilimnocola floriformis]|nr:DEAD/DEAH box helicase [Anatilimnocola floriformis]